MLDPYDVLPYRSLPIEWSAPERLALASMLHGGPRPPADEYRVLELGCAGGANLLPLAYYRRRSRFVGIDGARTSIRLAEAGRLELGLSNIEFIAADFRSADASLSGQFDYIIAHGVFSWVAHAVRDTLFEMCSRRLRPGGLLYLNYNARPGWNVRELIRNFLTEQTASETHLPLRAQLAQEVAARLAPALALGEHPYSRLLANEFRFVCENHVSYVAHEYLAEENHAYWRSEFLGLARDVGLDYICDADFNYPSGRVSEDIARLIDSAQLKASLGVDASDLLSYRQLHSPILAPGPTERRALDAEEFAGLVLASSLAACDTAPGVPPSFRHSNGYEVDVKDPSLSAALGRLHAVWPRGLRVGSLFADARSVMDDILLLHRNGLVELRRDEGDDDSASPQNPLSRFEAAHGGYYTSPRHVRMSADSLDAVGAPPCGQ